MTETTASIPASAARRRWPPAARSPRPIVTFGAGSIVGDAHFPAYRKAGFPVAGLYDPDQAKAREAGRDWGVTAFALGRGSRRRQGRDLRPRHAAVAPCRGAAARCPTARWR